MRKTKHGPDCDCDLCHLGRAMDASIITGMLNMSLLAAEPRHEGEVLDHVSRFAGECKLVFTDDLMRAFGPRDGRVNIHFFPPGPSRPFWTLVTAGLSDLPLCPPTNDQFDLAWAELAMCFPAEWRFGPDLVQDRWDGGPWYWPVKLMLDLAVIIHAEGNWIWYGHTSEFEDQPTLGDGVGFSSVIFRESDVLPEEFQELALPGGKKIHFLSVVPLYPDEIRFARAKGHPRELEERMEKAGVTDVVRIGRPSCL
ncbi:MAG: suppressor of fused domain protein [Planctomycetota bacterium]